MARRVRVKDEWQESRTFGMRLLVGGLIAGGLTLILLGRLFDLQLLDHETYMVLSEGNRVRIEPLAPNRGLIFDRNGVLLAENVPNYQLEVIPEQVPDLAGTLTRLAGIVELRPADLARFEQARRTQRRFQPIPLRVRLSEREVAAFSLERHRFPGVDVRARLTRAYPWGELTAHVVGYVGAINETELERLDEARYAATLVMGKLGVERTYESELHGEPGFNRLETNAQGRPLRLLAHQPPVPGQDLYLNLDIALQRAAEQALGDQKGAVVAMDPRNGEVLAFVSKPSYDPNLFVDGIDAATYKALNSDPRKPLYNRALNGVYPPGSTVKPMVVMAGVHYGLGMQGRSVNCRGEWFLPGQRRPYRDWRREGHGHTRMSKAISESCDVYFYELGRDLGIDRMAEYLSLFGFGRRTGIDLVGEVQGLMPTREWKKRARKEPWYLGESVITAIGQGYMLATPVQLAQAAALVAARGQGFQPKVLRAHRAPVTGVITSLPDRPIPPIDARNTAWDVVIEAMTDVVHGPTGTARASGAGAPYLFAGKTGTAQVFSLGINEKYEEDKIPEHLRDHGIFISFAPVEAPRIALGIVVENGGGGSRAAAPVARRLYDQWLTPGAPGTGTAPPRARSAGAADDDEE